MSPRAQLVLSDSTGVRLSKVINPLVHSVPFLGHYKKMSHFSHQRSLATELTMFYLENKSHASMG